MTKTLFRRNIGIMQHLDNTAFFYERQVLFLPKTNKSCFFCFRALQITSPGVILLPEYGVEYRVAQAIPMVAVDHVLVFAGDFCADAYR